MPDKTAAKILSYPGVDLTPSQRIHNEQLERYEEWARIEAIKRKGLPAGASIVARFSYGDGRELFFSQAVTCSTAPRQGLWCWKSGKTFAHFTTGITPILLIFWHRAAFLIA
ncbi:MAG: hypothetical protein A2806_00995 [Candidatus Terrybacteria bacterium RIFCSPHIGHO2_01_FULL_48_17]|uniref:Uncharacterized protein n=1 Tax=Candidatus Terrybacteria bacterium RIFCSPHIGHO2_01_FULL_48_17 TaxID=1802362 RepID=A0A1G2PK13_9BACT|nr:MAG: hypothetical protein A2806_00995 [Candidatus Terrybacteria bacterium RIFCSPHIGHO2_01_FULL_48_17]